MKRVVKDERELRMEKIHTWVTLFLLLTLVLAFIVAVREKNWISVFIISITFVMIYFPKIVEKLSDIDIPIEIEIFAVLFIYATLFLGEIHGYYTKFWWWDLVLHTGSALTLGLIGFMILYILYKREKVKSSPIVIALFSFAFAVAIGALWEIFEFSMDLIFSTKMQKSALDTMTDLIVDAVGGMIGAGMGYFYLKRKEGFLVGRIIKQFERTNPRFFR